MKKLLLAIVAIALMGCVTPESPESNITPPTETKEVVKVDGLGVEMVITWLMASPPADTYDMEMESVMGVGVTQRSVMRTIDVSQFDYPWRWDEHYVAIVYAETEAEITVQPSLYLDLREYKAATSTGYECQFTQWHIVVNANGEITNIWKVFKLLMDESVFVSPDYPVGFINPAWYEISDEEQRAIVEKEIAFWLEEIRHPKTGV